MEVVISGVHFLLAGIFFIARVFGFGAAAIQHVGSITYADTTTAHILFVGDVMLGRHVETLMDAKGIASPFTYLHDWVSAYDLAILNFEGTVPQAHEQTKNMQMRFSIREEFLPILHEIGFDVFSLANNHAYDYGVQGYMHTLDTCTEYDLVCRGNPYGISTSSTEVIELSDIKLGVLFVHTLFTKHDTEMLENTIKKLSNRSDIQVVYIHWGNEYELEHSNREAHLAHSLIDAGADLIVGHHPHVVQDVELYKDKLIVYSLGNFIFDQYFSNDVKQGLALQMSIFDNSIRYEFIPFESSSTPSMPRRASNEEKMALFKRIFANVPDILDSLAKENSITIPR